MPQGRGWREQPGCHPPSGNGRVFRCCECALAAGPATDGEGHRTWDLVRCGDRVPGALVRSRCDLVLMHARPMDMASGRNDEGGDQQHRCQPPPRVPSLAHDSGSLARPKRAGSPSLRLRLPPGPAAEDRPAPTMTDQICLGCPGDRGQPWWLADKGLPIPRERRGDATGQSWRSASASCHPVTNGNRPNSASSARRRSFPPLVVTQPGTPPQESGCPQLAQSACQACPPDRSRAPR